MDCRKEKSAKIRKLYWLKIASTIFVFSKKYFPINDFMSVPRSSEYGFNYNQLPFLLKNYGNWDTGNPIAS